MKGYKEYLFVDDGVGCSGKMVVTEGVLMYERANVDGDGDGDGSDGGGDDGGDDGDVGDGDGGDGGDGGN